MPRILQINALPSSGVIVDEGALCRCFEVLDCWGAYPAPDGELSLVFMSDPELAELHGEYCDDPSVTDVITFPGDAEMDFAGEICVSADRARIEAPRQGWSVSEELTLYLVHGWLHLAGEDDLDDESRASMREAEKRCLARLREFDAIPGFASCQPWSET